MKKIIVSLIALFAVIGVARASLWEFYTERGQTLPSVQDRLADAQGCGILGYTGTASQNIELEKCLRNQGDKSEIPFFIKLREIKADVGIFGAFNFVQVQDQYLAGSGITSSATTITIETFDYPDGTDVVMADFGEIGYATLEPNTTREENVSFTGITQNAAGTATFTGVTRGLGLKYPYTETSSNKFAHAGGTILRITNSAPFYNELVAKKNTSIIYGQLTVATTTGPITKLYFGDNNGAYFWYNSTTDQFGWASTTDEYAFNSGGTQFTTNETIRLSSGVLGLNTTTDTIAPSFSVVDGKLKLATSSDSLLVNFVKTFNNPISFNSTTSGAFTIGDCHDSSTTTIYSMSLTDDVYYCDYTVSTTATIDTNGYRIYTSGTFTNNGTVANNGGSASGATAGVVANTGTTLCDTAAGAAGRLENTSNLAGETGASATSTTHTLATHYGGDGGYGGAAGATAGGGNGTSASSTATTYYLWQRDDVFKFVFYESASTTAPFYQYRYCTGPGGAGGASGGDSGTGTGGLGGGGGAAGGIVYIFAKNVINTGTITANGGAGGAAGTGTTDGGGGGGGGGGAGGLVWIGWTNTYSNSGTITASGGAGGALGNSPGSGGDGQAGTSGTDGLVSIRKIE